MISQQVHANHTKRLGLNDQTQREWYYALLKKLSDVMPDVKTLFECEIEKLSSRNSLDYKELDIKSEYRQTLQYFLGGKTLP